MTRVVLPAQPLVDGPTALRAWRESDLPAIVEACQDPEIPRWTAVPESYGEADARAFLLQRYDSIAAGTTAPFAIVAADHEGGSLLGSISLMALDWKHRRAEVGYWLAKWARGQGHATRAVRLICGWGFDSLGLERVGLLAAPANAPSLRVAERAGFTREAVLRRYQRGRDGQQDLVAFGLLVSDGSAP
jgi:RimJ/RimL family protein N-acetyltransferase